MENKNSKAFNAKNYYDFSVFKTYFLSLKTDISSFEISTKWKQYLLNQIKNIKIFV